MAGMQCSAWCSFCRVCGIYRQVARPSGQCIARTLPYTNHACDGGLMGSLIAISGWRSPFAAPIADALIRQGNSVLALLHDEAVPSNTDRSVSFIKLLLNSGD